MRELHSPEDNARLGQMLVQLGSKLISGEIAADKHMTYKLNIGMDYADPDPEIAVKSTPLVSITLEGHQLFHVVDQARYTKPHISKTSQSMQRAQRAFRDAEEKNHKSIKKDLFTPLAAAIVEFLK